MEKIQLNIHLPFSYWQTQDVWTGTPLCRPDENKVAVYAKALAMEIASLGEDLSADYAVDSVRFIGGYMSLFDADTFACIMAAVHRHMHMTEDAQVSGTLFPGSLNMELLNHYRNYAVGALMFEMPSLVARECERMHWPLTLAAMDHTLNLMESYQFAQYGLIVPIGVPGRDEGIWRHILSETYRYRPRHIAFADISGGKVAEHPAFDAVKEKLLSQGMRAVTPDFYTAAAEAPRFTQEKPFVGIGVGAFSRLDGFETQNTTDIGAYLRGCGDYRSLIVSAKEI